MDRKYLLQSTIRTARLTRILAKTIDFFIAFIIGILIIPPIGIILAIAYLGASDCIQGGQSVGKKFLGFKVISIKDGSPCSLKQSLYRNLPLIVPLLFAIIPFWGWLFTLLLLIPLCGLEVYLLFSLDSGHRLGDVIADTTVVGTDPKRVDIRNLKESLFKKS